MKNYFDYQEAAKRYKIGRPNFHSLIVEKIKDYLQLEGKLGVCLDVACGTGLLSEALLEISSKVIGVDNSTGMLSQVEENPKIEYVLAAAENIEIQERFVDLITVSSAFHWFDQEAFLKSSYSLIEINKYLVIHNNYFTSRTTDNESNLFNSWMKESYLKKFISPRRNLKSVSESEILSIGFEITGDDKFENKVLMSKLDLIDYLITQSNIISNEEIENYSLDEVKYWLSNELSNHFENTKSREFIFGNHILFLKKK